MGVLIAVKCPHCQSAEVIRHGKSSNGKPRFRCLNSNCPYQTFSLDSAYPGRKREIKKQIVEMNLNGRGVRDIARVLHVSTSTVIKELKKSRASRSGESASVESTPTSEAGSRN